MIFVKLSTSLLRIERETLPIILRRCFLMKETLANLGWIQWNENLCSNEISTLNILIFVLTLVKIEVYLLGVGLSRSKKKKNL